VLAPGALHPRPQELLTGFRSGLPILEIALQIPVKVFVRPDIKKLDPDVIVPMHCSGDNFANAVRTQMPGKLLLAGTGSRLTFGA